MDFIILALDHNYFLTKDYSKLENDVSNEMFNQNKMIIENIKKIELCSYFTNYSFTTSKNI